MDSRYIFESTCAGYIKVKKMAKSSRYCSFWTEEMSLKISSRHKTFGEFNISFFAGVLFSYDFTNFGHFMNIY